MKGKHFDMIDNKADAFLRLFGATLLPQPLLSLKDKRDKGYQEGPFLFFLFLIASSRGMTDLASGPCSIIIKRGLSL